MRKYLFFLGALLMIAPAISEARVYCKSTNTGRFCAGLSTDTKPTVAETNDEFFETDTKDLYKYAGAAWSLYVNGSAAGGVGGNASEYVDDDDFVDGTTVGQLLQGVAEATGSAVTDGDIGALGMTVKRALKVTIVDNNDDSAVDATVNAVRTTAYVTENAATVAAADIDQTGAKTIITVDVGAVAASRLYCIFQNTDVAANTTLDEFNIYLAPAGYTVTSMPVAYTEADFASPSGALLMVRTGAGGDTTDATPDTTLDESDYMIVWLDVSGMDSVTFQASAAADNAAVDAKCTYN